MALYWSQIEQWAAFGHDMPSLIADCLWTRFKIPSDIYDFWLIVPADTKIVMRRHVNYFWAIIRRYYLGDTWAREMTHQFNNHRFRQRGHENETPVQFIM